MPQQLDSVKITSQTPFAAIYLSALDQNQDIDKGDQILVTAIARVRNTDMKFMAGQLIEKGKDPMLAEPVKATIQLNRLGGTLHVLDQDGVQTARSYPVKDGKIQIDTARDKTFYYIIKY